MPFLWEIEKGNLGLTHATGKKILCDLYDWVVSLNCCDELHFWKQVCHDTQSVKELYGHPIRKQLTRRPDMICQTRCHRWGHRSPCTR